jgi:hypothetical protein
MIAILFRCSSRFSVNDVHLAGPSMSVTSFIALLRQLPWISLLDSVFLSLSSLLVVWSEERLRNFAVLRSCYFVGDMTAIKTSGTR